jgi:hypothetical protein
VSGLAPHGATIKDAAGNTAVVSGAASNPSGILQIDTTAPTVSSVVASPSSGDLNAGKSVTLTVNFSEAVTVAGGTPTLTLNDGGTATYASGSGTSALTFSYVVGAGQNTSDLTVTGLVPNGATIQDGAKNNVILSGAVKNPAGILTIDTTTPTVTLVVASPGSGEVTTGHTVRITLDMSEAVTVSGSPVLLLNDGGTASYDAARSTSKALVFDYTVASGQVTTDLVVSGIELPSSSSIEDGSGNNANLSGAGANLGLRINTNATGSAGPSGGNFSVSGSSELELFGASSASVAFASSSTGTLKLDDSAAFTGSVSGLAATTYIDLADLPWAQGQMNASFSGNTSGGKLTVSDGTQSDTINLVGDYTQSSWNLSQDSNGNTLVVDPPLSSVPNAGGAGDSSTMLLVQFAAAGFQSGLGSGDGAYATTPTPEAMFGDPRHVDLGQTGCTRPDGAH